MQIGKRIRQLRNASNETQEQLARTIGRTSGHIAKLESGAHADISLMTAVRLAQHYGLSLDEFVFGAEPRTAAEIEADLVAAASEPRSPERDARISDLAAELSASTDGLSTMEEERPRTRSDVAPSRKPSPIR